MSYDSWKTTEPDYWPDPNEHVAYDRDCACEECTRERESTREVYLGDGLYGRRDYDGTITLRAPRGNEDHFVVLEPQVLAAFDAWRKGRLP
jgi:hypothetical protein